MRLVPEPNPIDTLACFAITILGGLALAGIVVSFLVSR